MISNKHLNVLVLFEGQHKNLIKRLEVNKTPKTINSEGNWRTFYLRSQIVLLLPVSLFFFVFVNFKTFYKIFVLSLKHNKHI